MPWGQGLRLRLDVYWNRCREGIVSGWRLPLSSRWGIVTLTCMMITEHGKGDFLYSYIHCKNILNGLLHLGSWLRRRRGKRSSAQARAYPREHYKDRLAHAKNVFPSISIPRRCRFHHMLGWAGLRRRVSTKRVCPRTEQQSFISIYVNYT